MVILAEDKAAPLAGNMLIYCGPIVSAAAEQGTAVTNAKPVKSKRNNWLNLCLNLAA
jgi:hypothetical protein